MTTDVLAAPSRPLPAVRSWGRVGLAFFGPDCFAVAMVSVRTVCGVLDGSLFGGRPAAGRG